MPKNTSTYFDLNSFVRYRCWKPVGASGRDVENVRDSNAVQNGLILGVLL